jgi:uncharacterized membrane protein YbhN (UPF0104 family)
VGLVTADPVRKAEAAPAPPARTGADEARRLWTGMVSVAAAGLLLGALVLAVPGLHDVLARIEGVDPGWIALWICFRASGETLPIGAVTLAFLIGYLANVVPVPGGIGALDGGLVAALVAYGAHPASAAAAVLLYHAIVVWIPALIGTTAFLRLRSTLGEPVAAAS